MLEVLGLAGKEVTLAEILSEVKKITLTSSFRRKKFSTRGSIGSARNSLENHNRSKIVTGLSQRSTYYVD